MNLTAKKCLAPCSQQSVLVTAGMLMVCALFGAAATAAQAPDDANHSAPSIGFVDTAGRQTRQIPTAAGPAVSWGDNFDRANSTNMGPNWTELVGDQVIQGNYGRGKLAVGWSYMLHNTASLNPAAARMEIDLLPPSGSSGPHVALIAGANGSTQWF